MRSPQVYPNNQPLLSLPLSSPASLPTPFFIRVILLSNRIPSLGERRDNTALVKTATELITQKDKRKHRAQNRALLLLFQALSINYYSLTEFLLGSPKKELSPTSLQPNFKIQLLIFHYSLLHKYFLLVHIVTVDSIFVQCLLFSLFSLYLYSFTQLTQ